MKGRGRDRSGVAPLGLFVLALSACGARTPPGEGDELVVSCEAATPCGGDLVGRWEALELCADLSHVRVLSDCETSSVFDVAPQIAGVSQLCCGRDVRDRDHLRRLRQSRLAVDLRPGRGRVTSCQRFGQDLLARGQQLLSSAECAPRGEECVCDLVLLPFEQRSTRVAG